MEVKRGTSWWEFPATMLPALLLVGLIFYTARAAGWI